EPGAPRVRDRQLLRRGARRRHRGLRRPLPLSGGEERRVRLPRGRARLPRRRLRRAPAPGLRGARQGAAHPAHFRPHHARRALVPGAGIPRCRRGCFALPSPGALQLEARLQGVSQAPIIGCMARTVKCVKLGREAEGLEFPPYPGALGKRIWENVSKEAWQQWLRQQTMLVNENRLNLADPKARKYRMEPTEWHFFGEGAVLSDGYVPPKEWQPFGHRPRKRGQSNLRR